MTTKLRDPLAIAGAIREHAEYQLTIGTAYGFNRVLELVAELEQALTVQMFSSSVDTAKAIVAKHTVRPICHSNPCNDPSCRRQHPPDNHRHLQGTCCPGCGAVDSAPCEFGCTASARIDEVAVQREQEELDRKRRTGRGRR